MERTAVQHRNNRAFIIKCGANSSCELVIKADVRVQEPKGGEVIRVVPRPSVLADLSFEEIKRCV